MTEPFTWIDSMLRSHSLAPPDWAKVTRFDGSSELERFTVGFWWCLYDDDLARSIFEGLNRQYPDRHALPFACDSGSDDIACFVLSDPQSNAPIVVIHDLTERGWEVEERYNSFEEWVTAAMNKYRVQST